MNRLSAPAIAGLFVAVVAGLFVLYPVAFLLQAALNTGDPEARPPTEYGFDNFAGLLAYPQIILNTLTVSFAATIMALILGFLMAWIITRTNVPGRRFFEQMMVVPYYLTPLLGALAWSLLGTQESGFLNQVYRALGGSQYLININTPYGIAWVMALFEGSVAFVMIGAVMKSMDPALEEASQVMGASRWRTMLRITLPLVLPGVLGAAVFVFSEMLGSFAVALVLGLPDRYYVVTTAIYQLVQQYPPKIPLAAAMGTSLFVVMFVTLFIYRRIITAGSYVTITGKAFRPRVNDVGRLKYLLLRDLRVLPVLRGGAAAVHLVLCVDPEDLDRVSGRQQFHHRALLQGLHDERRDHGARQLAVACVLDRDARHHADGPDLVAHLPLEAAGLGHHRIHRDVPAVRAAADLRVRHDVGMADLPDPDLRHAVAAADRLSHGVPAARRAHDLGRDAADRQEPGGMRADVRGRVGLSHAHRDGAVALARAHRGVAAAVRRQHPRARRLDPADGPALQGDHAVDRGELVRLARPS